MTISLLHTIRAALVNHTTVSRICSMIEYSHHCHLNFQDMLNAYLAFESLSSHTYDFFCFICGHHPAALIYDATKKPLFRMSLDDMKVPSYPRPTVDAVSFWSDCTEDHLLPMLDPSYKPTIKPSYDYWAPYVGPHSRSGSHLYSTGN